LIYFSVEQINFIINAKKPPFILRTRHVSYLDSL
jgi:hypothetical protein